VGQAASVRGQGAATALNCADDQSCIGVVMGSIVLSYLVLRLQMASANDFLCLLHQ
jgi:hypothetical protein